MMQEIPSPRYTELQPQNDSGTQNQDDASADSKHSLLAYDDEEKAWSGITERDSGMLERRPTRRERIWSAVMSIRSILDTILLLVILGLVLDRRGEEQRSLELNGDITGFAPRISKQIKRFKLDHKFVPEEMADFFTEDVQSNWLSIVPRGLGFITINDTQPYNYLPTPVKFYPDTTFSTSVTHQLHCLHSIIELVAAYQSNQTDKLEHKQPWHISHCLDYLRQSIMCCGDMALEGQHTTFPANFVGTDGWDASHVCRDYSQVLEHLERHRADNEVWI